MGKSIFSRSIFVPVVLGLFVLILDGASTLQATALPTSDVPCGTPAYDACADIGEPSDEAFHSLTGWGINEIGGPTIPPSGDSSKRFQSLRRDNTVRLKVPQVNVPYTLYTEIEDGGCDDSWAIYVNGQGPVYTYHANPLINAALAHQVAVPASYFANIDTAVTFRNLASDSCGLAAVFNVRLSAPVKDIISEARLDIGMPYPDSPFDRGCPSDYVGCGGPYHGFYQGVCSDLVMDAYNAGVPFNIQNSLYQDYLHNPGRYRWGSARNADDMRRYFTYNQQFLPHSQAYQAGDIAFFSWDGDSITDHVLIVSQVDVNGRPRSMVDASGPASLNPSGRAFEHNWSLYYEQHVQGHGRLISSGPSKARIVATETLQVLQVTADSLSVALSLADSNGKSTSSAHEDSLVASNNDAFIPYIPGGTYANLGTTQVISVTQPLSNTTQYTAQVTGNVNVPYHLTIQTLENGTQTATSTFTQTISSGETQGVTLQLSAPGGVITFTTSLPVSLPSVNVTPIPIQMVGLPGSSVNASVTVNETSHRQALNGVIASIGTLMSQAGQTIPGSSFSVTPSNFDVAPGGSQSVQLQANLSTISPGVYLGNLTIASTNGGVQTVPLSLKVQAHTLNLPFITR